MDLAHYAVIRIDNQSEEVFMFKMREMISDDRGTAGLEYALLLSLVGLTLLGGLQMLGIEIQEAFLDINGNFNIVNFLDNDHMSRR